MRRHEDTDHRFRLGVGLLLLGAVICLVAAIAIGAGRALRTPTPVSEATP